MLIAVGGGCAFYSIVLREYYLWATRKKSQISARKKNFIAWVGTDQRHWPSVYILLRGLIRKNEYT